MYKYVEIFLGSYSGYWNYLTGEILNPSWHNYFYWLIMLSLGIWLLEIIIPWRKNQSVFRQDFWMDGFYMFFNFFLFSLIAYNAISNIAVEAFTDFLGLFGIKNMVAIQVHELPKWVQLFVLFVVADFIHWNVHRMLHRYSWMWEFHKVHHSVKEMGFAAHLRFHWMESIFYKTAQYIPLAMIGFGLKDFFIVHIFATAIGHLNHSNLNLSYGPFKYVLNNPKMHIWHHVKKLPAGTYGVNYGISLSLWDYIFRTVYMPENGRDIELGFEGDEDFPKKLKDQLIHPWESKENK
ncbi:sterol desaturase family protein [Pedobacter arcticus]|uniref:sterol desaturase family protein n=1 Tax=Pedobacter arcticus TaxID=752140 RepID=UPI0002EEC00C|nr:sterol desaturase family protein [Pedobacter arcticus]